MSKFLIGVAVIVSVAGWLGFYAYMSAMDAMPVARMI